ncbi:MAG: ABC transporter permease [Lachnospiraceae bacterium]|nr:ABC transporter permease [Lachnospiraceae bacterium]
MVKYLAKRIGRSLITLFIIICVVFILMRQMPIEGYFQNFDKLTEAQIQAGLEEQGLLDPMPVQLLHFFQNMLKGDFGVSHSYRVNVPVTEILADKLPISIKLGSLSVLVSLIFGIPLGTIMARFKSRIPDKLGTLFIVFIQAVPAAVYYLFIQMYGTLILDIPLLFDASNWKSWILPVFSMSLGNIAYYGMWLRRYMVDESNKDYVRLAKAKGASGNSVMFRHIFRNAFVPMVQYLPSSFLNTVIGSIYVESLYSIPGMGGLLVTVIKGNDNNMVQAIVLLYATVGVIGLLLGDIMMVILDPRISLSGKEGER